MSIAQHRADASSAILEPGDRMQADEFDRLHARMPEGTKAELIEGIVYMQRAVKLNHGQPLGFITTWIGHYCFETPGTDYANDATDRLDESNRPQPDVSLFILPESGGQTTVSDDGYLTGGPELVVEIAGSSLAIDRGPKRRVYEQHGVQEYLIWRVANHSIEFYVLRNGQLEKTGADDDKIYRSQAFPGLWLNVEAALRRDGKTVLQTLASGLATDQHHSFVERLSKRER